MFGRNQTASDIERQHLIEDLVLTAHDVKRESNKNKEKWNLKCEIPNYKTFQAANNCKSVPYSMQRHSTNITDERHQYTDESIMRFA